MTFKTPSLPAGRIHYAIPGHQPELAASENNADVESSAFQSPSPLLGAYELVTWREVLALDSTTPDASMCAPPPRFTSPGVRDASAERQQWRRLLSAIHNSGEMASMPLAVGRMLVLLEQYQQSEVALLANGLSDGGL
jgi:hypothetical protein